MTTPERDYAVDMKEGAPTSRVENVAETSADSDIELSVVVPTFNEAQSIETTLASLYESSPLDPTALEVIVVDESIDETPAVVRSLDYQNLRLMCFDEPKGLAESVTEGLQTGRGTYLGVIDADGQHPPAKLYELFETAVDGGHDIVVASRYVPEGGIENWSRYRRLVSLGATFLGKLLLVGDVSVADPMSGFFVVRGELLADVTLDPIGYKILLEILVKADIRSIAEVGYVFTDRDHGESNLDLDEYVNFVRHVVSLTGHRLRR